MRKKAAPANPQARDPGENQKLAEMLRERADLLQAQGANPFRIAAYRKGADQIARLARPVREVFDAQGRAGLQALPGVGTGIANALAEMLVTGNWSQLARLRGGVEPEKLFQSVPGIGPGLARTLHDRLHVDTLEALEVAAHEGRLAEIPGVGARRAAAIRAALGAMLRRRIAHTPRANGRFPTVAALLEVDREYRDKAAAGKLPTIAPSRFNPRGRTSSAARATGW